MANGQETHKYLVLHGVTSSCFGLFSFLLYIMKTNILLLLKILPLMPCDKLIQFLSSQPRSGDQYSVPAAGGDMLWVDD